MKEAMIVCDPEILNGKPVVQGTRVSVALVLQCIASGMTREEILQGYPNDVWALSRISLSHLEVDRLLNNDSFAEAGFTNVRQQHLFP